MSPPRSLRQRLQATTYFAILAGYGLLLVLNQALNVLQRYVAHDRLVSLVSRDIAAGSLHVPHAGWVRLPSGTRIRRVPNSLRQPLRLLRQGQERWLVSSEDGIEVWQNITVVLEDQRRASLLLLAVAGFSSLVTSTLLERVLRDGLEKPLRQLSQALVAAEPTSCVPTTIDPAVHPEEFRQIVTAYNALHSRLVEAWQQQRTYIDGVAHELRTPLTLISGYAQRLDRLLNGETPHSHALVQQPLQVANRGIVAEADRMARLVRDLLDLARGETHRLELQLQPLDAGDALLSAFERLEPLAAGRLRLASPALAHDLRVFADPERLSQCLANLVDNALRYSPADSPVQLAVEREGALVVLHVRDQGPGVPVQERQRIFDLFERGSTAPLAPSGGSGIGLAMVKLLIERMGGSVHVDDAPGGGADFQLLLPAADADGSPSLRM